MPTERLPMRKIREALRLHAVGLSKRWIAVSLNIQPKHEIVGWLASADRVDGGFWVIFGV
jgi:hypothetical protein